MVLGACDDGGYYLLGMRHPHARLFADIAWSSGSVAATTRTRIAKLGLDLVELPLWYDIDDAAALERLARENDGYAAPWTRRAITALGLDRSRIPLALHERQTTARSAGRAWHGTPGVDGSVVCCSTPRRGCGRWPLPARCCWRISAIGLI